MQNPSSPFRPDFERLQRALGDDRPADRVLAHYVLERELSAQLRSASRETRSLAYAEIYDKLFASLPDHPQRCTKSERRIDAQLHRIAKQMEPRTIFLELGCGDAALGFVAARKVQKVYGLDVTDTLIDFGLAPRNFEFLLTTGIEIPLAAKKVDFAYSNQLLEHLHPEDAAEQLREVYRVLKPGGRYMCITPSRVSGPHDVSRYFGYEAKGLHLREYDYGSLRTLFHEAGFQTVSCCLSIRGREIRLPSAGIWALEHLLLMLPGQVRARLTMPNAIQRVLGLDVVATK